MNDRARWLVLLGWALVGCGAPNSPALDGGPDAGMAVDAGWDAGLPGNLDAGIDGGVDGGRACDRASATLTADFALFDALKADLAAASSAGQRQSLVDAFLAAVAAAGGTPLTRPGSERVVFVARGAPSSSYGVGGSWNNWQPSSQQLSQVGGSDLYAADLVVSRNARHEYKLVDGATWFEDKRARHVTWDGINHNAVGEFNAVVYPALGDSTQGRLVAWRGFHASGLNDDRDVFVYLPAAYDHPSCPVLPSVYFHDGNESLTRVPFTRAADAEYAATPAAAAVLVFIALPNQNVRMSQYTFGTSTSTGDAYLAFLRDDLVPAVSRDFRVCPGAKDRGAAGASLGGLISAYAAFQMPGTFGYVGSQSGSFFWNSDAMVTRARDGAVVPVRFYLDHGCPNDNCVSNRALATELSAKGYELQHLEEAGGQHDWAFWEKRLPGLLRYFRQGRAGCL